MSNKVRSKQIIIIAGMLALVGFLFSREVKGLIKPKEEQQQAVTQPEANTHSTFTVDNASAIGHEAVSMTIGKEISALESTYKKASESDQFSQAKVLAKKWDDVEQSIPSAMYLEVVAIKEPVLNNWLAAGTRFLKAFDNTRDSVVRTEMLQRANGSFTKAMALDSSSIEAKTGLGVTIVNGMGAPMQGITMLLDVVKRDPKNMRANMNLGVFAIQSGQFDKAITRFNTIISTIQATPDAYFYLGKAYESLGKNTEAIDAYLNSKKLAANPTFTKFIDERIAEIKNKR
ncbi:MAG: hypothetical protein EOO90_11895 [Pedobacter sp.]|nr:MAG: hypothetical protein EOO90_11895 [Pedobacter sp.]